MFRRGGASKGSQSSVCLHFRNNKFRSFSTRPTRMWGQTSSPLSSSNTSPTMVIHTSHWPSVGAIPELSLVEFVCSNPFNVPDERTIIIEGGGPGRLTFKVS